MKFYLTNIEVVDGPFYGGAAAAFMYKGLQYDVYVHDSFDVIIYCKICTSRFPAGERCAIYPPEFSNYVISQSGLNITSMLSEDVVTACKIWAKNDFGLTVVDFLNGVFDTDQPC